MSKKECECVHGVEMYDDVDGMRYMREINEDERDILKKCDRYKFCPWCGRELEVEGEK